MSDTNRPDVNDSQTDASSIDDAVAAPKSGFATEAAAAGTLAAALANDHTIATEQPALQDDLAQVVALIEKLNAENATLKDRLVRAAADAENLRKRAEKERQDTARYAISKFSKDIIEVADTFQRALDAVPYDAATADKTVAAFVDGVAMTERQMLTVLERHGIRRVEAKGQKFDPNVHQAVTEIANPDIPDGFVAEVFQTGYLIEDRVLRPAMVAVARGGGKAGKMAEVAAAAAAANDDIGEPPVDAAG